MVELSPLERLLWVRKEAPHVATLVDQLLELYLGFLEIADQGTDKLEAQFHKPLFQRVRSLEKREFGAAMFHFIVRLGEGGPLYRWIVV